MEPTIKKIQTAIFIKNFQIQNEYEKSNLLLDSKEKIGDIFDGQPILIPAPNEMPPEIPRIVLNSADNLFSCNIALNRTDIFFNSANSKEKDVNIILEKQKTNSLRVFDFLKEKNVIINRIGFVVDVEYAIENAIEFLKAEFINENKFESPKELSFRYNRSSIIEEINIPMNNLVTVSGKNDSNVIQIQLDINTVSEIMSSSDFSKEYFDKIITYSENKINSIIKEFPNL
ncbi:MAG: hypothetical protein Q8L09_03805 [Candidatus Moranbacteria bacterium]|nr:hypothetical protein [Candidatus Moranbacteria bacterium]